MGYATKVQLIKRKNGDRQFYVNFPVALAQAMNFAPGEPIEWSLQDQGQLVLQRPCRHSDSPPASRPMLSAEPVKKKNLR